MKSEKTAKELAGYLEQKILGQETWVKIAEQAAAELGVELAPERPELPGWVNEAMRCNEHGMVYGPEDGTLALRSYGHKATGDGYLEVKDEEVANRAAFVEIHRRWLAAKQELDTAYAGPLAGKDDWRWHGQRARRLLRGED